MEKYLKKNGFIVHNINYPSRKKPIEELSKWVRDKLDQELGQHLEVQWDFVTHSMGGIILRQIMKTRPLTNLGRVVMLGPPIRGARWWTGFDISNCSNKLTGPPAYKWAQKKKDLSKTWEK